jgi:hypothetical protein
MSFDKRCLLGSSRKQGILSWKMEGKADKLLMTTIAERSSSYLFYGLYITYPSVPRLGLTNFLLWRFLEFKRNWLFERRLSSKQQLKTLPYSHLFLSSYFCLIPLSQDSSIPALFLLCGPTILPLEFSDYPSSLTSMIPPNPSTFAIPLSQHFVFSLVQLPRPRHILSRHFEFSDPAISALQDLWSHYQHY